MLNGKARESIEFKELEYVVSEYEKQLNKIMAQAHGQKYQAVARKELANLLERPTHEAGQCFDQFYHQLKRLKTNPEDRFALASMKDAVKELQEKMVLIHDDTMCLTLPKIMDKLRHKIETILIKIYNFLFSGHHYTAVHYAGYVPEKHNITTCHQAFFRTSNDMVRQIDCLIGPEINQTGQCLPAFHLATC